nr:hypothetical protein CFP56_50528 [Quercus suber]
MLAIDGGLECLVSFSLAGSKAMLVASSSVDSLVGGAWEVVVGWEDRWGVVGLRNGFSKISGMGVVGCSNRFGHCLTKMEGTFDEDGFEQDGFEQEKKGRKMNRALTVACRGRGW